ncbi:hypothetical protein BUE80_DR003830 [Diplocarpon rosae]|nr:hypothetical protein BUE80_DR003830 [Diplocarpon rosae]
MSDYLATQYGAPYREQPGPPYLAPAYTPQYMQPDQSQQEQIAPHYDASATAFAYNRSAPSFSASAVASGVPPLPIFQGWNQESIPLPTYTGYENNVNPQYFRQPNRPSFQQHASDVNNSHGKMSEGEFDNNSMAAQTSTGYGATQYRENGRTGYSDTVQRAVYSKPEDHGSHKPSYSADSFNYNLRDSPKMGSQQSGFCHPYNPSGDYGQSKLDSTNSYAPKHGKGPSKDEWSANSNCASTWLDGQTKEHHAVTQGRDARQDLPAVTAQSTFGHTEPLSKIRSVADSRKKAQGAILNLWPYDVRYQTYIDEGFSKDIVESLFDELKMTRNNAKAPETANANGTPAKPGLQVSPKEDLSSRQSKAKSPVGPLTSAKKRVELSTMEANAPAPAKQTVMTDKEKTLQSKMEALRKSREERAQKAASKNVNRPATSGPQAEPPKLPTQSLSSSIPTLPATSPPTIRDVTTETSLGLSGLAPQQQSSIIPGLFLASTTSVNANSLSGPNMISTQMASTDSSTARATTPTQTKAPSNQNTRKRPVAADFDQAVSTPYKRPFGHSSNGQRLVINVSEDEDSEDDDVAMDLESQADQDSPVISARKMSDQRPAAIRNIAPLSNFPARKPFSPPSNSSTSTAPPMQAAANNPMARVERLGRVESEMEALKKQIAAREARQKAKQTSSGSYTPRTSEDHGTGSKTPTPNLADKIENSVKMQQMIQIADSKVAHEQQKLADAQAEESAKAEELKKNEAEQKRLRREKIAADIPLADAIVSQGQSKLEQLRAQMEAIEAEVQKGLDDKRKLAEEMERLGQEAEEQLQAQKDKLSDLDRQLSTSSEDSPRPRSSSLVGTDVSAVVEPAASQTFPLSEPETEFAAVSNLQASSSHESSVNVQPPSIIETPVSTQEIHSQHASGYTTVQDDSNNYSISAVEDHDQEVNPELEAEQEDLEKNTTSTDQALEAALQEAVRAEVDSHAGAKNLDADDSYAPDPSQLASKSMDPVVEENRSPEYSPTLDRTVPDVGQSDEYEPPEATPPADEPPYSPPFSPAPPDHKIAIDGAVTALDDLGRGHIEKHTPSGNSIPPEVAGGPAPVTDKPKHELFKPYESPLKRFAAYRFHPSFKQDVQGGLRSKTYSHKIKTKIEFCRYELAGGICNDATCAEQHFRDIVLPGAWLTRVLTDDAVLTALGSPEEFKGEQRERFCAGLKGVLMDLRVRKIRDFDIIASDIIAHRAKFLGDKSKVLASLEGTSI